MVKVYTIELNSTNTTEDDHLFRQTLIDLTGAITYGMPAIIAKEF